MTRFARQLACALLASAALISSVPAQIDPESRNLLNLGFNQSLHNDGPNAAYAFYYWNMPDVPRTNTTLRVVIAPVYLDAELGFKGLLGKNTDLGLEVFGGGFYNSYAEVRQGNYYRNESFDGNGGGGSVSVYHLFNPEGKIPLNGLLRASINYHDFEKTGDTADNFTLPENQPFYALRAGLRWGGKEPMLGPRLAMELSAWYEMDYRPKSGLYGFDRDRELNSITHQFIARALGIYTTPRSEDYIMLGAVAGAVIDSDRFSAFRLGGALPFTSEIPLYLPGYFYQELSAKQFGLLYGLYGIPLDKDKQWLVFADGAVAAVDYIHGLKQPGDWNSGVGSGLAYTTKTRRWRIAGTFSYGIDAMRSDGRGGYSAACLFYYNFGRKANFASDRAFDDLQNSRNQFRYSH